MPEASLLSHAELSTLIRTCYYILHLCAIKEKAQALESVKTMIYLFVDSSFR